MTYRAIYFDTETTGINPNKDYIIEIAAYDPLNDKSFEALIKPPIPIPPEATRIHNISDQMVEDKENFATVGKAFWEFCQGPVILVAHNNDQFDKFFLKMECQRHELNVPDNCLFFDTLKWARKYRPDLPRHSLQYLREVFGFEANNAHRAMDDVVILFQVFQELLDDIDIHQAWKLLYENASFTMPFGKHKGKALEDVPKDYVWWLKESGALDKVENQELFEAFDKLGYLYRESLL